MQQQGSTHADVHKRSGVAAPKETITANPGGTHWSWGDTAEMIAVDELDDRHVSITRGPDSVGSELG